MMARTRTPESKGDSELVVLALGGLGEIGMNCYLYGLGPQRARKWLMIDLGITFPGGEVHPGRDVRPGADTGLDLGGRLLSRAEDRPQTHLD